MFHFPCCGFNDCSNTLNSRSAATVGVALAVVAPDPAVAAAVAKGMSQGWKCKAAVVLLVLLYFCNSILFCLPPTILVPLSP